LFRDRLGETERADRDRAVAVGDFFEQKGVHDGGLFDRGRACLRNRSHQAEPPGRDQRLRKSRRLIGAARGGREFSPREFGDRGARDLLFLG
jgi:hypothetical protein